MDTQMGLTPSDVVQKQLEAYNRRDIDDFMQWWAPDCEYFAFPSTLLATGADEIRQRHVERFEEPNLNGILLSRVAMGNLVIDHERVIRTFPEGPGELEVICIYEVDDGKITSARFKIGEKQLYG
ncbi:nuclear transport factor 2 family protein [uncultured Agrobacterium sp.]|uniref:nuclear transport factor 2 family protein n=1 Tax=uncultured Agrobacterium sp. TaxID=157277 RepID=UPI002589CE28|nr:nuclear transport factor 2 family protein [uncultured Agrobacterium sp.]